MHIAVPSPLRPILAAGTAAAAFVAAAPVDGQSRSVRLEFVRSIGAEASPQHLVFGDISGVAVTAAGEIVVFDRLNLRMSAFTRDGAFLHAAGRDGKGPQEFGSPSWPVIENSTIYIPDAGNGRLSRWQLRAGQLIHQGQTAYTYASSSRLCSMAGHMYLLQYHDNGLIQRINLTTNHVVPFGAALYTAPGLNPAFISGVIGCDQRAGAVYVASNMSVLRRYDAGTGRLMWQVAIPGVIAPRIEVGRHGLPQYSRRPAGEKSLSLVSVIAAPNGLLLVQGGDSPVGAAPGAGHTAITNIRTIIFDAASGQFIETRTDLPRLDYAYGNFAYGWPADPFPQVRIYRWR
jgi:hypothetical protein